VQGVVEDALARMTGAKVTLRGAGRTDAGVHARAQVATFTTEATIPHEGIERGLNAALPPDVAVVSVDDAPEGFEPRRSARGKHYVYRLWNRRARSPLHARTSWHVLRPLDIAAMTRAAGSLLGEHDFSTFRAAGCDARHPVRVMRRIAIEEEAPRLFAIHMEATAFLRGMARSIAGTLVEVGLGRRTEESVAAILEARDRRQCGRTAPARGLMLWEVRYEPQGAAPRV
jgi:tRNA pseudouridine38-40 synthase